jgi:hypothetical protein
MNINQGLRLLGGHKYADRMSKLRSALRQIAVSSVDAD